MEDNPSNSTIRATARIVSVESDIHFKAELPNGKPIWAHLPERLKARLAGKISSGDQVTLEISLFDFDRGRVIDEKSSGT